MEREYCVYMHVTPSNKVYIGITGRKLNERWQNGRGYSFNRHFSNAINKYGWDNIEHRILEAGLSREEASERERYYIALYDSTNGDKGYNLTTGGEANYYMTDEFSKKCSKRMKEKYKSAEALKEASERSLRTWSKSEYREKMSAIHKDVWQREEYKRKISASRSETNKRRWEPGGDLRKRSEENNWPNARGIEQYTTDGLYIKTFPSITAAKDELGIPHNAAHISSCASGKRKTAYGFKWKYAE